MAGMTVVAAVHVVTTVHVVAIVHVVTAMHVVAIVHVVTAMHVVAIVHVVTAMHVVTAVSAGVPLVAAVLTVMIHVTIVTVVTFGCSGVLIRVVRGVLGLALPVVMGMRAVLVVMVTWRFPAVKLGESAIESLGDLPGVRDRYAGLGRRDGSPQIRCPGALLVALLGVVTTQDHEQISLRGRAHTRPPPTYQFRLDGEPLARASGGHRQQNSRPGNSRPQEPAPQLHRKAPSRQA
ncbi:hypothetical protein [Streptomyces sp. NPDC048825]|uniref:hypothetical protein n=1 Tax=Streptomyces sp. NPDC048825 TaxID=3365592 RepID=UPI003717E3DA